MHAAHCQATTICSAGHPDVAEVLLEHGAICNEWTFDGELAYLHAGGALVLGASLAVRASTVSPTYSWFGLSCRGPMPLCLVSKALHNCFEGLPACRSPAAVLYCSKAQLLIMSMLHYCVGLPTI
jgi:hypothetical protein